MNASLRPTLLLLAGVSVLLTSTPPAHAQSSPASASVEPLSNTPPVNARATVEDRVGDKSARFYALATGTWLVRNDFYDSPGYGLDAGYYFNERWGAELRLLRLHSSLSQAGTTVLQQSGLAPDLRAPDVWLSAGVRSSVGYAKILLWDRFVTRFDPQLVAHAGVLFAEERIAPSIAVGPGVLVHLKWDLQVKFDLLLTANFERRQRGITPAFGVLPTLSFGWSLPRGGQP
ncbi:hypothetical protein DV096_04620 [Bradymonadaceae bacterium TMQ3]|nr:hypothetical protein DV096_04620 [Bradymonadaceae bacterium TMQ3]TXC77403.1 hypothetical protein FRC91_01315 [Bradymonadales bacterium TMQ1]